MTYAVRLERSAPLQLPRHEVGVSEEDLLAWCETQRKKGRQIAVDLFSGAGGLGFGVERAGWAVAVAVDHDAQAVRTHQANFPGLALKRDLSDPTEVDRLIEMLRPLGVDLLVGGPPCQPFSRAGRSKIRSLVAAGQWGKTDPRKDLWTVFLKIALAIKPRGILMENVPDMALADDLTIVRSIADSLENVGYQVDFQLLDAWKFGVPQHRRRLFLQARSDSAAISWPAPRAGSVTIRDAISDLPRIGSTTGAREHRYKSPPGLSKFARAMRTSAPSEKIHDHMTRPVRPDDLEIFELMDSRTLYADLPARLRRYRADTFNDKYNRLGWDELSRTVTAHIAKDGYWYIHPEEHRTLTVREAARLQTFPDRFRFAGTRSDAFRQIGNAVPPELARSVAECLSPTDVSNTIDLPRLRSVLDELAQRRRRERAWLYPGPKMTRALAVIVAALDLREDGPGSSAIASAAMRGKSSLLEVLARVSALTLSEPKQRRLSGLRRVAGATKRPATEQLLSALTPTNRELAALLLGENRLIVTARSRRNVERILGLAAGSLTSQSAVKLALARVVGSGELAPLRMALILAEEIDCP